MGSYTNPFTSATDVPLVTGARETSLRTLGDAETRPMSGNHPHHFLFIAANVHRWSTEDRLDYREVITNR